MTSPTRYSPVGAKGATPRRNHFNRPWRKPCEDAGIKGLHFHDLRHTGNTLAASTGASTRELMSRMGHSTARAGLIYQHAGADRDRLIAKALSNLVDKGRKKKRKPKKKQDRKPKGHAGDTAERSEPPKTIRARSRNHPLTWP
ncbi:MULTISPECIES: tyrosine-type recombinase/integrase [unclassified Streptomyces]|uniref:tyrosine-type recombinase/integrase n=1 Tax=unclassified Streptomyces TaxID=2593676 RepID=UPI002365220B|nr:MULTISPECIES: tyrosine-type recombinase/integrase [unclassified Streptomyces]MDF3140271.1 tyrosine-type recombinase/integrase [Streptomyces sp. T21Q-yed]WDF38084.1 tyrosine-type recombinase/integrase [Streptomyces sp. T12]